MSLSIVWKSCRSKCRALKQANKQYFQAISGILGETAFSFSSSLILVEFVKITILFTIEDV